VGEGLDDDNDDDNRRTQTHTHTQQSDPIMFWQEDTNWRWPNFLIATRKPIIGLHVEHRIKKYKLQEKRTKGL